MSVIPGNFRFNADKSALAESGDKSPHSKPSALSRARDRGVAAATALPGFGGRASWRWRRGGFLRGGGGAVEVGEGFVPLRGFGGLAGAGRGGVPSFVEADDADEGIAAVGVGDAARGFEDLSGLVQERFRRVEARDALGEGERRVEGGDGDEGEAEAVLRVGNAPVVGVRAAQAEGEHVAEEAFGFAGAGARHLQHSQKFEGADEADAKGLLQHEPIPVVSDDDPGLGGQGGGQVRIIPGIPAALFAARRRFHRPRVLPIPGEPRGGIVPGALLMDHADGRLAGFFQGDRGAIGKSAPLRQLDEAEPALPCQQTPATTTFAS